MFVMVVFLHNHDGYDDILISHKNVIWWLINALGILIRCHFFPKKERNLAKFETFDMHLF